MKYARVLVSVGHGDWKTASVRPGNWPTLHPNTIVEVLGKFNNFYGTWIKVRGPNGSVYDIEPHTIQFLDKGVS